MGRGGGAERRRRWRDRPVLGESTLPPCEALSNLLELSLDYALVVMNASLGRVFLPCVACELMFGHLDLVQVIGNLDNDVVGDIFVRRRFPPVGLVRLLLHLEGARRGAVCCVKS